MKYISPKDEHGNPYYVPIVAKNKDFLIGYLKGLETAKDIIEEVMESIDIKVDLGPVEIVLDSTRFNDLLENGKRESEMTDDELKSYFYDIMEEISTKLTETNSENGVFDNTVLKVECSCGFEFKSWEDLEDVPETNFLCRNCGKILIHYTNVNEYEYEYDEGA